MSIIDGTTSELICGIHDYKTRNLKEWHEHVRGAGHYAVGSSNCPMCGEEYAYTEEDKVPAWAGIKALAIHPECRGDR
jgi:hypothetical protein